MTDRLPCDRTADKVLAALAVDTVDMAWHTPDRQPAPHQALDLVWSRVCPDTKTRSSVTARVDGWGLRKVEKRVDGQQVTGTVGAWDEQLEAAYRWLYGIGLLAVLLLSGCDAVAPFGGGFAPRPQPEPVETAPVVPPPAPEPAPDATPDDLRAALHDAQMRAGAADAAVAILRRRLDAAEDMRQRERREAVRAWAFWASVGCLGAAALLVGLAWLVPVVSGWGWSAAGSLLIVAGLVYAVGEAVVWLPVLAIAAAVVAAVGVGVLAAVRGRAAVAWLVASVEVVKDRIGERGSEAREGIKRVLAAGQPAVAARLVDAEKARLERRSNKAASREARRARLEGRA